MKHFWSGLATVFVMASLSQAGDSIVVVLLDDSGSMRETMQSNSAREPRMAVAKSALTRVVKQLPEQTKFGLMLLNGARGNQGWLIPLGPLDRGSAIARIQNVRADGATPLGQSMKTAMDELLSQRIKVPYGDYRLLVVTDGEASDRDLLEGYIPDMVSRGIIIDVIGVDMRSEHSLAKRTHSYRRASDASSFEKALTEVFAESASSGTSDSGASDFDVIAGLPDEFAVESLKALAIAKNGQIAGAGMQAFDPQSQATTSNAPLGATPAGNPPAQADRGSGFGWFIIIMVVTVFVVSSLMKSKRRRH